MTPAGLPIVLTADRTLLADYRTLLDGMLSASQTTITPGPILRGVLAPRMAADGLRARRAPLGLRRLEAALLGDGFRREEVGIVPPERLGAAIGPETRVVAISTGDPLGLGMTSTTMSGLLGGKPCPAAYFGRLSERLRKARRGARRCRVVVGGAGAWQLAADPGPRERLGVDHVVLGYSEGCVAGLFRSLAAGDGAGPVIEAPSCPPAGIPAVRGATVMGVVEISRGCGKGCRFCALRGEPMRHLPEDTIVADVETNLDAGVGSVAAISEDFFRYGAAPGAWANPPAVKALLLRLRSLCGFVPIQIDHANIASIAEFPDDDLVEIHQLLTGDGRRRYVWVNLGVETSCGELLCANGGAGKIGTRGPQQWGELCAEQVRRLVRAGFLPFVSLIMGLPGETPEHVTSDIAWVRSLKDQPVTVFPLFYAPLGNGSPGFGRRDMSPLHWRLMRESYELNFRWMPRLVWDNQTAAGESLFRRLMLQALGRAQVVGWRSLFALRSRRLWS